MNPSAWVEEAQRILLTYAVPVGGKIIGAILLWVIGRAVIHAIQRLAERSLEHRHFDTTLTRYARSVIGVTLNIFLVLAILSIFGIETTSFAGILAAAGVAVGLAWSGLLANFAAGLFLMVLRPFKVGELISAGGVIGRVVEIGLFFTAINTGDNLRTYVGNNKILSDNIQNYSQNPYRRVELKVQLQFDVDVRDAIAKLKEYLPTVPNVLKDPAPVVAVLEVTDKGPLLAVRPFCHTDHYWDLLFTVNLGIVEVLRNAGHITHEQHLFVHRVEDQAHPAHQPS